MGSKTKIYIVLEYATGGELFDIIVSDMHVHSSLCSFCYTHCLTLLFVPTKFNLSLTNFINVELFAFLS
jgi:serine/threonine protein kinase